MPARPTMSRGWSLVLLFAAAVVVLVWFVATGGAPDPQPRKPTAKSNHDLPEERRRERGPSERNPRDTGDVAGEEPESQGGLPVTTPSTTLRVTVLAHETGAGIARARVVVVTVGGTRLEAHTYVGGVALFDPAPSVGAEVAAYAPGRVRGFGSVNKAEPGAGPAVTLSLAKGERLAGRVLDPDGRPVLGVRVDLDEGGSLGGLSSVSAGPLLGTSGTDAEGTFAFDGVPVSELVTLLITHPGFTQVERTVRLVEGGDTIVEIRLAHGASLIGTVRGPDFQPVPGARVLVAVADSTYLLDDPDGNTIAMGSSQSRVLSAHTDDEGRFEVHGLQLDAAHVAQASDPGIGRSVRHEGIVARTGGERVVVDLQLRRLLTLMVRVVDDTGKRVPGASVRNVGDRFSRVEPDDDGDFRMGDLEAGEVVFEVNADGYVKNRITHLFDADDEVAVRLDRGQSITGIAVNDAGEPLPDARIRAMRPMGEAYNDLPDSGADTQTDGEGRFEVGGLRDGAHMILCWADGHDRGKLEPVPAGAPGVRVVCARNARVSVELRVPPGSTAPAKLDLLIRREDGATGWESDWPADGRFEESVPAGPVTLVFLIKGYGDVAIPLDLEPGVTWDLGLVTLDLGETATGRVVDPNGLGIPNAEVRAVPPWSFEGSIARTADDGRFVLPRLGRALYRIDVEAAGFLDAEFERDTGKNLEWNVSLARGALVSGSVRGPDGVGVSDGVIRVLGVGGEDADDSTDFAYLDNTGRFAVRVRPGRYRVAYEPKVGDPVPGREIVLGEGGDETVEFDLTR